MPEIQEKAGQSHGSANESGHIPDVVGSESVKKTQSGVKALPCPFCGGKVEVISHLDSWDIKVYSIKCKTKGCIMNHRGVQSDYKKQLIVAWNKRA